MLKEIQNRRSIRKYLPKDVDDELILQLLASARYAPSGSNTQPWHFLIVRDKKQQSKIVRADHNQTWMLTAPVFIVCAADINTRITNNTTNINLDENCALPELKLIIRDSAIAIEHIVLEAEHLGIATCWTAWFNQDEMKKAINAPTNLYICAVLTVGFADEAPTPRPRKKLIDLINYENW
ncbi:nitroreductase family protein [Pectinatus cerevisiiphilus]|uniref:Nitroreductase n=1 Tax=Pectinatus cerevisiiphilus TaxID=86956 RepID=A0A4V2US89_9FIRM|nr:nitroreductase family protein [Pectinatus cerevisiiphilus]TCS80532.1 nitroreductase [Pectinatus cerevisiiphilus]